LFSSPFGCLIIAQMLVGPARRRPVQLVVAAVALALVPLFVLTRYGNESFEQVRPNEIEALRTLYRIAPPGSELVSPTSQVPWRFAFATDYDYSRPRNAEGFLRGRLAAVRVLVDNGASDRPGVYLVITTSQLVYSVEALGEPPNWFDKVPAAIDTGERLPTPVSKRRCNDLRVRGSTMTMTRFRVLHVGLLTWATLSFFIALLPSGTGGLVRAVNAVVFLTLGPACALAVLLARAVPPAVAWVIAIAASLTVLVLSSQMLLIIGLWAPWRVAALVSSTTIALVLVQIRTWTAVNR
jgi:hypothetical protein